MKKILKTSTAVIVTVSMVLSLSSCSLFRTMRENAEKAAQIEILDSPEEENILSSYNKIESEAVINASEIKENISYSAGTPEITKDGEKAGILAASAKQLKKLIMDGKPGKSSRVLENGAEGTLLGVIAPTSVFESFCDRNISRENATDEKGNERADENGNVITVERVSDNTAHFRFEYFDIKNSDGSDFVEPENKNEIQEESTKVIYSDDNEIKAVFGEDEDKQVVLDNFDCISDFIKIKNYDIEYKKCTVSADADLRTGEMFFVKYDKNMTVTVEAEGVGELSSYGDLQIVLDVTKTVNYEFSYPEETEETDE